MGSEFLSVTWYTRKTERRSQTNIANKLPIQFSYAENTATLLLRSATSLLHHILPSEFSFRAEESSPQLIARVGSSSHFFSPSATEFARCSFDNDRVKCKYHRVGNLTDLLPSENYVKHPVMTMRMAFCHFERERKYVAARSPFTSRICLFNAVVKSGVRREEFGVISLRYSRCLGRGRESSTDYRETGEKRATDQDSKYFQLLCSLDIIMNIRAPRLI